MSRIAGLDDFRKQGPPADVGSFLFTNAALVFSYTFSGTTYYASVRTGITGWVLVANGTVPETVVNTTFTILGVWGHVMLASNDFTLAAVGISFTNNDQMLEGNNHTLVDGNALPNGVHAINISAVTGCTVETLRVRTLGGGGNICHCIYIEDGADQFRIEHVRFLDSDAQGIHIEGTTIYDGWIVVCWFSSINLEHIYCNMDAGNYIYNLNIHENICRSPGSNGNASIEIYDADDSSITENKLYVEGSTARGIYIHDSTIMDISHNFINDSQQATPSGAIQLDTVTYSDVDNNIIYTCADDGIHLLHTDLSNFNDNIIYGAGSAGIRLNGAAPCDFNTFDNNIITGCTGQGIALNAGTGNIVHPTNYLLGNAAGAIVDGATDTRLAEVTEVVKDPNGVIGTHPAIVLTDGVEVLARFEFHIPSDFQALVRARVVIVPGGTGNLRRSVSTNWGKICVGEDYNVHSDSIAEDVVAVTINDLECIDVADALTGIAASDDVGLQFIRHGDDGTDTVNADCYLVKLNMQYV